MILANFKIYPLNFKIPKFKASKLMRKLTRANYLPRLNLLNYLFYELQFRQNARCSQIQSGLGIEYRFLQNKHKKHLIHFPLKRPLLTTSGKWHIAPLGSPSSISLPDTLRHIGTTDTRLPARHKSLYLMPQKKQPIRTQQRSCMFVGCLPTFPSCTRRTPQRWVVWAYVFSTTWIKQPKARVDIKKIKVAREIFYLQLE